MKNHLLHPLSARWLLPLLVLTASALPAAESTRVALFLEPDRASEVYFRETLAWAQAFGPRNVAQPADRGVEWLQIAVVDMYLGYVDSEQVGKDLSVPDGTLIRVRPEADAPVLAVSGGSIQPEAVADLGDWITVEFTGAVDLFYHLPEASPAPAAAAPMAPAAIPFILPEQPVAPAQATRSIDVLEEVEASSTPLPYFPAQPNAQLDPQVSREYAGVLRRNSGFRRLVSPAYPYYLESADGQTMAFVELNDALIIGRIERFFDQPVILTGTTRPIQGRSAFLIQARFIRDQ